MSLFRSRRKISQIAAFPGLPVHVCVFTPDNRVLVVAGGDGKAHLLDLRTCSELRTIDIGVESRTIFGKQVAEEVRDIRVSGDGRRLGLCRNGGRSVAIWDIDTGARVFSKDLTTAGDPLLGFTQAIALSPDGSIVAVACSTGQRGVGFKRPEIYTFDIETGNEDRFGGHQESNVASPVDNRINDVSYSPDGRFLISVGDDGRAIAWALDPSAAYDGPQRLVENSNSIMWRVCFSHAGTAFAAGTGPLGDHSDHAPSIDRTVVGHDAAFTAWIVEHRSVEFLAFNSDDSKLVVACSSSDRARPAASHDVWLSSLGSRPELVEHDFSEVVAVSPDASRIASLADGTLLVWDVSRLL